MKKFLEFSFVLFVLLGGYSCTNLEDRELFYAFWDEPAIVKTIPIVQTAYGDFLVPDLTDSSLEYGDILWASFLVDTKEKKAKGPDDKMYHEARGFTYAKIDSAKVTMPADSEEFESYLSDDYSEPIQLAVLYKTYVDSLLFFGFEHKDASGKSFEYELVLNPATKSGDNHPTFYIRAKKSAGGSAALASGKVIFAFDMTEFVEFYKEHISEKGSLRFNLKYKTGTDDRGEDAYREFLSNPISWSVK